MAKASEFDFTDEAYGQTWGWNRDQQGDPVLIDEDETSTKVSEREALERFDDFLNECWETVHICGYNYDPARALKMCDKVAYWEEFNNWLDSEGLELE